MKIDLTVKSTNKIFKLSPVRIVVLSFLCLILAGSVLLTLPVSSASGEPTNYIDALFTATSASCITGLIVHDTATYWSDFGKIVIITLIQIGGLGIITLSTFLAILLRKKIGLRGLQLAQESINTSSLVGVKDLIRKVILITFSCELAGAVILFTRFYPRFGWSAIPVSLFHSISAFCNAGFDILGTPDFKYQSLMMYYNDPIVLITIASLIIIGGLGFIVWSDILSFKKERKFQTHSKTVIIATIILILFGAIGFYLLEADNPQTMGYMSFSDKIINSLFQSISPRTAGFNSIPLDKIGETTKALTILLMFIGAAPGSTGGGVKVTTVSIIIAMIFSYLRGHNDTIMFKRIIPWVQVKKAISIIFLALFLILSVTVIIVAVDNTSFIDSMYEATSGFGTVGLTVGITPDLHTLSKLALISIMFIGRVGPVSFAISLLMRANRNKDKIYPEAKVLIG